ncbi:MAG TPA: DNA methyltransferase [Terriglobia bacterium]|nr:DNA methyltransferase [Terriglobia bacterium]
MPTALFDTPILINGFRDPAFTKNRDLPLHRWVPWIAGFSAQFVDDCLVRYLAPNKTGATVLDPFAGVGTTLVEAFIHGHNVIGFEINPYAALAARLKLDAVSIEPGAVRAQIAGFQRFMDIRCPDDRAPKGQPRSRPPIGFSGRTQLFSPPVERRILFALDFINLIGKPKVRDLFRLALGSVMVSMSNYSYEPSLTRRSAVDKEDIPDARVAHVLRSKLELMRGDIEYLQEQMRTIRRRPKVKVYSRSFFSSLKTLKCKAFVDLVVTSPPYLNNYHYPRNTRPQLHWLGMASGPGYNGAREEQSFGKFWQTVRDQPPMRLSFSFPLLEETIEAIRGLNTHRGSYGGPGWANYVTTYFNDAHEFCKILKELLRPQAVAIIVLGNSVIQGVEVKTEEYFGRIAQESGLTFEDCLLLRKKRTGTSIIRSSVRVDRPPVKTALYESAIILRK